MVPIIVNGSLDQTDYFREVKLMTILIIILIIRLQMFTSLNGLMIPGGPDSSILPDAGSTSHDIRMERQRKGLLTPQSHPDLNATGFSKASYAFFSMAMEANHAGDFFPIWGTCLGMEMLGLITTGGQEYLTRWRQQCWKQLMENPNIRCTSYGSLPLELSEGWENSQLYGSALIMIFLLQIN